MRLLFNTSLLAGGYIARSTNTQIASLCSSGKLFADNKQLTTSNWKQDVVYLYQFPRSPVAPNLSPFCLKVETFLRANRIKYEAVGSMFHKSPRGLLPFVEVNGEQIADSQVILWKLHKLFSIEDHLAKDPKDRAVARAVERMIEMSTFHALQWDKSVENGSLLLHRSISGAALPGFITNLLARKFSDIARKRINGSLGKMPKQERIEMLRRDIEAIDGILGDKKFLFGDRITTADCAVFGQLGVTAFLPYRQTITDLLEDDYPRVLNYLERIKTHYFPDWPKPK